MLAKKKKGFFDDGEAVVEKTVSKATALSQFQASIQVVSSQGAAGTVAPTQGIT